MSHCTLALARDEILLWIRHHVVANPHLTDKVQSESSLLTIYWSESTVSSS